MSTAAAAHEKEEKKEKRQKKKIDDRTLFLSTLAEIRRVVNADDHQELGDLVVKLLSEHGKTSLIQFLIHYFLSSCNGVAGIEFFDSTFIEKIKQVASEIDIEDMEFCKKTLKALSHDSTKKLFAIATADKDVFESKNYGGKDVLQGSHPMQFASDDLLKLQGKCGHAKYAEFAKLLMEVLFTVDPVSARNVNKYVEMIVPCNTSPGLSSELFRMLLVEIRQRDIFSRMMTLGMTMQELIERVIINLPVDVENALVDYVVPFVEFLHESVEKSGMKLTQANCRHCYTLVDLTTHIGKYVVDEGNRYDDVLKNVYVMLSATFESCPSVDRKLLKKRRSATAAAGTPSKRNKPSQKNVPAGSTSTVTEKSSNGGVADDADGVSSPTMRGNGNQSD